MAEEIDRLLVRIEANATQFDATIKKMNRSLHGAQAETRRSMAEIQKSVDGASMGIRRSALMATSALAALGVSFGAAQLVKDFREGEEAAKRLEAVLKTTGHAAGLTYGQIASWARELEEETGRSATEIQNAAAQLATFTSIGRREFTEAIEVATDMAAVFGGDLKSNLDAVARALDDPIEGFANLRKRGFALTEAELKRAEAHMKAGRFAEAQQVVLQNLSSQVDGAAKAVNTGLTKALNDLQRQAGDTFKQLADQGGTAAAIAALELATKGVAFLGDNMGVLLDAAQALAIFIGTNYVASWLAAEKGMVRTAISAARAEGAVKALQAALSANAVGLATLAVAGLVTGLVMLAKAQTTAEITAKAHAKAQAEIAPATSQLEKLVRKLAAANDEETASIRRKIDALLAEERLKAQMKRNAYLEAKAEVASKPVTTYSQSLSMGGVPAGFSLLPQEKRPTQIGPNGNPIDTVQETTDLKRLRIEAEEAEKAYRALAETAQETVVQATTPLEYTDKDAGKNAKAAEQRRRLLEDLKSQTALEVAQLDEQVAKVRELERQAEITARIRQLEDAGFKAAQARAISGEVQTKLDEARARAMEREEGLLKRGWDLDIARLDENWETVRAIEEEVEKRELVAALAKVTADETSAIAKAESMLAAIQSARVDAAKRGLDLAREEHRLAVAQLSGNRALTKELQDQAAIRERTKAYQAEGYGLKPAEAQRRATEEVTRERTAATYGEHRELFASAFSDGIRAAMAGDLQGFLSNQFGNFADRMFQKAGEQIFDSIFGGVDAVAEGASQGAAMAATVTPAITGAGAAAGASMAASITAAGAAAGASMAAAIAGANITRFAMLPGFSEGGYTGPGGVNQPAGVAHKGEVVWSQKDVARAGGVATVEAMRRGMPGYAQGGVVGRSVIPGVNAAVNRISGASQAQQQPIIIKMAVEEGALFQPTIEAVSGRVSVQTTAMGVATVQDQQRTANMRRRQSLVG
ncbi:phage tail length tape measure family protein [Brevundimonas naejangsanensis]|uniref:phage tail length tape measure family protein n=1 Tax=Brevundimonas naejangsanensis TaxID=588932 RepID=UPI0026ECBAFD|nr:phage tail length tape measure family protein [Brevundimonas naejangsanensis]